MSYRTSDTDVKRMFDLACENKKNSYSPYSHFRVSAALLCSDGTIICGVNVENCSYPNGCCAERSAIVSAVSQGHRDFVAILITSDMKDDFIYPCGFCRQVIAEFGNLEIISTKAEFGEIKRYHLSDLLPEAFTPADLSR